MIAVDIQKQYCLDLIAAMVLHVVATSVYQLDTQSDKRGSHAFSSSEGTSWYSVEVDFVYGGW